MRSRTPLPSVFARLGSVLIAAIVPLGCGGNDGDSDPASDTTDGTQTATVGSPTGTTGTASTTGTSGSSATQTSSTSGGSTGGATVSYAADVAPIFEERCTDCHHPGVTAIPNIADPFDPTNGLIAFPNSWKASHPDTPEMNVVPGDPANSFLIQKITETTLAAGAPMPWSPERVTSEELADLRQWVTSGALNDAFYESNIRRIFGNAGALGARGGKCTYCHYEAGVVPNLSDPFDPVDGVVNIAASTEGWTRVVPGDPDSSLLIARVEATETTTDVGDPMPKVYPRLTADEVETVTRWILEGAQDN